MGDNNKPSLIHVAKKSSSFLFLRQESPSHYVWYEEKNGSENPTGIAAPTIEEAIRLAKSEWKNQSFRTLNCGFRYTLPERDEHGNNALFNHMVAAYSSPTGTYFDTELGHNCQVHFASVEALDLLKRLKQDNRL